MCEFNSITENDIPLILPMMETFYAIDGYPIDIEKSKALFKTFIADENLGKAWLIYNNGQAAGYVILTTIFSFEYGGKIAFIDELYIKEAFRGKGIGKASVTFLKEQATKLGLKVLYLEVEHHNSNAQDLYLKSGFTVHNRRLMQYKIK